MKAMPALFLLTIAFLGQVQARAVEFSLRDKEVVAFTGGTNVVRAQEDGSLESMLTHFFADKKPIFRDMSWEADTVYRQGSVIERWRKNGFGNRVEQLERQKITLVIAQFGQLESMQGEEKLEDFENAYNRLIGDYLKQARQVVLVTPLAFEKPVSPLLPDLTVHNPALALYVGRVRKMAAERQLVLVDLFAGGSREWTENGMHLRADAHQKAAALWMERAGLEVPPRGKINLLREAVREKSRLWFDYWRPANWKLLYGDDSRRQFTRGKVPFREEWKRLIALIARADERIRKVVDGQPDPGHNRPAPEILHGDEVADIETETKAFEVGYGLKVNLFADERLGLTNPLAVRWDPNGRAYVSVTTAYPHIYPGDVFNDKILILEDMDGDGRADKSTVFADGLNIPTGFELGDGGVYVGESTKITFLEDTDGDDRADRKKILLSGFGSGDSHQAINSFVWSPGGDLYMGQGDGVESRVETPLGSRDLYQAGIYRLRPKRLQLDPLLDDWMGPANPWGMAFDEWGQMFVVDGAGGVTFLSPGQVPTQNRLKLARIGSPGGYCGLGYLDGGHLPEELRGAFATGDFKANRIKVFSVSDRGAGFKLKWEEPLLRSSHRNFRPVDVNVGPDGAVYVVDWSNSITCHQDDAYRDPRRDKAHGRIWRISSSKAVLRPPKLMGAPLPQVLDGLKASEAWTRSQAKRELSNRDTASVAKALDRWVEGLDPKKEGYERYLMEALSAYSTIELVREALLERVARSKVFGGRAFAARITGRWADRLSDPLALLTFLVRDEVPRVRMEAVLAAAQVPKIDSIKVVALANDREMDRSIEYAFTQAVHHLKPLWEKPFEQGLLNFEKPSRLAAVLNRAGSKNMVGKLRGVADNETLSTDQRKGAILTLLAVGGPREFREYGLDQKKFTSGGKYDPGTHSILLARMVTVSRERGVRPEGELTELLLKLLDSGHEEVVVQALDMIGLWSVGKLEEEVLRCARDEKLEIELRSAAFLCLARLNSSEAMPQLKEFSEMGKSPGIRNTAIQAMCLIDIQEAANRAAGLIATGTLSQKEQTDLFKAFLSRSLGEDRLVGELKQVNLKEGLARRLLQALYLSGHLSGKLNELLGAKITKKGEALAADEKTIAELVRLAREKGNPVQGEAEAVSCIGCHRIGLRGGQIGPDLSFLGTTLSPERIVEEVLWPNRQVKEGYSLVELTTVGGGILQGYERSAKPGEITIRELSGDSFITLNEKDVASVRKLGSAMPSNLTAGLSRQRLLNLIQYLVLLGKNKDNVRD